MFKLASHENGKTGLVAVCDFCNERVQGGSANLVWNPQNSQPYQEYKIACKDCEQIANRAQAWQELDVALIYLLRNTATDLLTASRNADTLEQL